MSCDAHDAEPPVHISHYTLLETIAVHHLTLYDTIAFRATCRDIFTVLENTRTRVRVVSPAALSFPPYVRARIPRVVWADLEFVTFRAHWVGDTAYVDGVQSIDVPGHPFRWSRDEWGRLMVLMRIGVHVVVLFQRYRDTQDVWAFASRTLPIGGARLTDDTMVTSLKRWLTHRRVSLRDAANAP